MSPERRVRSPSESVDPGSRLEDEPGDAILVKASRSVGLEGIPASIEKGQEHVSSPDAGHAAMVVAIVIGPTFIEWLRRMGVWASGDNPVAWASVFE